MKLALFIGRRAVFAAFAAMVPAFLFAQSGGQPGQFMAYGAGARALGMGGAFFAVADDATASYWNPAGLALLERKEFTSMQASLFAETSLSFLAYAQPTNKGTWAFNITQLKSTGFEKIAITPNSVGDDILNVQNVGSFDSLERAMAFSWGRNVSDRLSFGIMLKNIQRSLDSSNDNFRSIDITMLQRCGSLYRLAFGIQNVFSMRSGDTDDKLPLTLKVGNALNLFKGRLVFGFDVAKPQKSDINWRFGGEYWLLNWWGLRFGIIGSPALQEADFGFGLRYRSLGLDIAQGIHELGTTTRFSFSLRMGESNRAKSNKAVRDMIEQAYQQFRAGNFSRALEKLQTASDGDPGNKDIRKMIGRLQIAAGYIANAAGGEEVATLIRKGVVNYVDNSDLRSAVSSLRYAFNKNPRNEKLLGFLNVVEKEAGVEELT